MRTCALVFDAPDGGVPEHVLRVALGVRDHGWKPLVLGPDTATIYEDLGLTGVPIVRLPFRPGYHPFSELKVLRRMIGVMRANRVDLVNTHSPKAGAMARLAALMVGIPAVSTAHGFAFDPRLRRWPGRLFPLAVERSLARRTAAIICISEDVRQLALKRRLASPAALYVIHNGAPACDDGLEPDAELESFSRDGPLAGCICVLTPRKGVAVFLEAARRVLNTMDDARFAVIGNGMLQEELQRYAHELGLDGRVRFFDYKHPSARQLQSLDVFVLPSLWEALPIGPLEAMACGVPQVVTDVGGTAEAVSHGETGFVCPPNDALALAEHILRLLNDPGLLTRMSDASRNRHQRLFTLDRMVDRTAAVFDEVLARRSPTGSQ